MDEDTNNYCQLEIYIKSVNLKMICEQNLEIDNIKKLLNIKSNVKITLKQDMISFNLDDQTIGEYFINDENHLICSLIKFDGKKYHEEFLGYKFYSNDKVLILFKGLSKYSSNFTFYEINDGNKDNNKQNNNIKDKKNYNKNEYKNNNDNEKNKDYYNFIITNIFNKIDYHKYDIGGYKYYIYFYIYSLYNNNEKKKELNENKIIIKIVDDQIDECVNNLINISKFTNIKYKEYIYIYILLLKKHCAILINIKDSFYLFDSSYFFIPKLKNIFMFFADKINILNKYKIQNLGTCIFQSISFLSAFITSVSSDKKFIEDLYNKINSYDFVFKYITELNKLYKEEDRINIFSKEKDEKNYFYLGNNIYINKNAYKNVIIDFNEVFKFLSINELNIVSLLIKKENSIYLKIGKIESLHKQNNELILKKLNNIESKEGFIDGQEEILFNQNIILDDTQIDIFCQSIYKKFKINKIEIKNDELNNIKQEIKNKISVELKEKYLNNLIRSLKETEGVSAKRIIDIIIKEIFIDAKQFYLEEYEYYIDKALLISKKKEKFNKRKDEILQIIDNYNNLAGIEEFMLSDLDSILYELDFHISQFQEFFNELN